MRIGWRNLFGYLTRKSSEYYSVGIEVDVNEISLAAFKMVNKELTWVLYETFPIKDYAKLIKKYVADHELENTKCVVVFASRKYQVMQVDRPPVEDAELAQALKWSVQELLSAQEEMQVDYFDLPAQTFGANKVNVAAIKKDDVDKVCKSVIKAGLFIQSVTIEELAICDLLPKSSDAVIALVQKPGAEISLNIIKEGKLYFNRSFRGYESLSSFSESELKMGLIDNLSVEIQRSMDFFESQLRQGGVKRILVQLDTQHLGVVIDLIKASMLMEVDKITLDIPKMPELESVSVSCATLGAALMKDAEAFNKNETSEKTQEEGSGA